MSDHRCETCGVLTGADLATCHDCWELESRLGSYLRRGDAKARAFVARELAIAEHASDGQRIDECEPRARLRERAERAEAEAARLAERAGLAEGRLAEFQAEVARANAPELTSPNFVPKSCQELMARAYKREKIQRWRRGE